METNDLKKSDLSNKVSLSKELVVAALLKHNWHRKLTAKELNISERTLYRLMQDYDLE